MSMTKSSAAYDRHMEEQMHDRNSYENYLDWQYHERIREQQTTNDTQATYSANRGGAQQPHNVTK